MKKWITEDWTFEITAVKGKAEQCRLGIEEGDVFRCQYECPAGFCPKTMPVLYTLCEIMRCGGSFRLRGSDTEHEIDFPCADGCVEFHLRAIQERRLI
ncbi:MAG: TIGR04076 family protein [Clostridiaceae bacterium]|nr:TIGR04076 family protein [Clostridiaceae bacterium]